MTRSPARRDRERYFVAEGGSYVVAELPPATYDITIKQANFKEYVSKGVQLFVSSTTTVNIVLTVGSATEQMTVEANALQVETTTGAVGALGQQELHPAPRRMVQVKWF